MTPTFISCRICVGNTNAFECGGPRVSQVIINDNTNLIFYKKIPRFEYAMTVNFHRTFNDEKNTRKKLMKGSMVNLHVRVFHLLQCIFCN